MADKAVHTSANEERLLSALTDLLKASSRQTKPGIQAVSTNDSLELTLRFSSTNPGAAAASDRTTLLNKDLLRKMAAVASDFAM